MHSFVILLGSKSVPSALNVYLWKFGRGTKEGAKTSYAAGKPVSLLSACSEGLVEGLHTQEYVVCMCVMCACARVMALTGFALYECFQSYPLPFTRPLSVSFVLPLSGSLRPWDAEHLVPGEKRS